MSPPIYEFECPNCKNVVEKLVLGGDKCKDEICKKCDSKMKKRLGTFNFNLKGEDWYKKGMN